MIERISQQNRATNLALRVMRGAFRAARGELKDKHDLLVRLMYKMGNEKIPYTPKSQVNYTASQTTPWLSLGCGGSIDIYCERAISLSSQGKGEEALSELRKIPEDDYDERVEMMDQILAKVFSNLKHQGLLSPARGAAKMMTEINQEREAYSWLIEEYARKGERAETLEIVAEGWSKLEEHSSWPEDVTSAQCELAEALTRGGMIKEAFDMLVKDLKQIAANKAALPPDYEYVHEHESCLQILRETISVDLIVAKSLGLTTEEMRTIEPELPGPTDEIWGRATRIFLSMDRRAEARQTAEKISGDRDVLCEIATAMAEAGEEAMAAEILERLMMTRLDWRTELLVFSFVPSPGLILISFVSSGEKLTSLLHILEAMAKTDPQMLSSERIVRARAFRQAGQF